MEGREHTDSSRGPDAQKDILAFPKKAMIPIIIADAPLAMPRRRSYSLEYSSWLSS